MNTFDPFGYAMSFFVVCCGVYLLAIAYMIVRRKL